MKTEVFVYGTLKRGGSNHRHLARQEFVTKATTVPGFTLYGLGDYPGMVRSTQPEQRVTGEVWSVDDATLARLDRLEGLAEGLYCRVAIRLAAPFPERLVQSYLYARAIDGAVALGETWPT